MPPALLSLDDDVLLLEAFDAVEQDLKDLVHARFQAASELEASTECVIYTGCWEKSGQGRIRVGARTYPVSRVAAWLYLGLQLWGLERAVRTCASPACINPEHLTIARDQAEASRTLMLEGRVGPGRNTGKARHE